jgi:hypothetical protein
MKKIYYLIAIITIAFASCKPLSNVYNDMDAHPVLQTIKTSTTTAYVSYDAAKAGIPTLLNTKYSDYPEGSSAIVSFPITSGSAFVADNLLSHNAYTMLAADYIFTGNTTAYLTSAGAINYLNFKYPTPAANQLAVLTYLYFEASGGTATAGNLVTDSFLFLNNTWTKIYTISAAQYTNVGRGANGYFIATDVASLPAYFNAFLLDDPTVMATAKTGDVKFISYRYTATLQQVLPLTFDGTNWVNKSALNFLKFGGTWIPDPTVFVTIPATANNADYTYLATTTIGTESGRANVASFGDFDIRTNGAATAWSDADLTAALAAILLHKIASPIVGIPYKVTYAVYTGSVSTTIKNFKFDGTNFVVQP